MWSYTTGTTRVGCDRLGTHAGRQLPDTVDVRVHLEQILQGWVKGVKRGRSMGAQKLYDGFAKSMAAPIYMNLGISSGPCHASIVGLRTMGNVGSACTDSLGDVELDLPTPFEQEDNKGELFLPSLQKYARQLYYFTASHGLPSGALRGTDVLEVGCGRGRGGIYVAQTFEPNRYVGMDLSQGNVDIATSHYGHIPNAQFIQGNADSMSFKNTEFDVVLSVESSHNYPSFERFIAEVYRVLKPGGRLLWVDVILGGPSEPESIREHMRKAGFQVELWEYIGQHVLEARLRVSGVELVVPSTSTSVLCQHCAPTYFLPSPASERPLTT